MAYTQYFVPVEVNISPESTIRAYQMMKEVDLATKDTQYSGEVPTFLFAHAEFSLNVTALTGSSPTLIVTVEVYDPATNLWYTAITFTTATAATTERKTLEYLLGTKMRIKRVTGGTSVTDCDWSIGAIFRT